MPLTLLVKGDDINVPFAWKFHHAFYARGICINNRRHSLDKLGEHWIFKLYMAEM